MNHIIVSLIVNTIISASLKCVFQFYSCLDNDQFFISQPYSLQVLSRALHTTWNCPGVGTEESTDLRQKEMWYITEIKGSEGIREPTDSFCLWSIFCK